WHVGQCVESVEHDPVARMELALVVRLECALGWRQARALGVVDKIYDESDVLAAISQRVEAVQATNARLEDTLAALPIDVLLEVARQRRDDLHALAGEKLGEPLLS